MLLQHILNVCKKKKKKRKEHFSYKPINPTTDKLSLLFAVLHVNGSMNGIFYYHIIIAVIDGFP